MRLPGYSGTGYVTLKNGSLAVMTETTVSTPTNITSSTFRPTNSSTTTWKNKDKYN
ncbi:MAG: hypothetical protein SVV03_05530 [Candidatus Nanohaloarchaea archaeon]|nr:hypothetical protein [Candidatus Nanohaloarchaea archaeon]